MAVSGLLRTVTFVVVKVRIVLKERTNPEKTNYTFSPEKCIQGVHLKLIALLVWRKAYTLEELLGQLY